MEAAPAHGLDTAEKYRCKTLGLMDVSVGGTAVIVRRVRHRRKLRKRVKQIAYLCLHPVEHWRCARVVAEHRRTTDRLVPYKYLGDYLSLDLSPTERRLALREHYRIAGTSGLETAIPPSGQIWRKLNGPDEPPLRISVESASLAPMEGELQLSFYFRTHLFSLTFTFAPGRIFGAGRETVMFIGGLQGRARGREEIREASRLNGEISPAAMLLIAARVVAKIAGAKELVAVGMDRQISMSYAAEQIRLDYQRFWLEGGGIKQRSHYHLPLQPELRPLTETARTHRSRTRRKREAKALVSEQIEQALTPS